MTPSCNVLSSSVLPSKRQSAKRPVSNEGTAGLRQLETKIKEIFLIPRK
jgi:hypothetical protein